MQKIILFCCVGALTVCFNRTAFADESMAELKREIAELKSELASVKNQSSMGMPQTSRPSNMTEQEFIELHRTFQDKQENSATLGGGYPRSLVLAYKKIKDGHPEDRAFYYLYARMLKSSENADVFDYMVKTWPDFSYGYRLKSAHMREMSPPDCYGSLAAAKTELSIDPDAPMISEIIADMNVCVLGSDNAPKVRFTYDLDGIGKYGHQGPTVINDLGRNKFAVRKEVGDGYKTVTFSMSYVGLLQLQNRQSGYVGPGFRFDIAADGDPGFVNVVFIPKEGKRLTVTGDSFSTDSFKANNGVVSVYIGNENMVNIKDIQLSSASF